jgi:hypothetical protein
MSLSDDLDWIHHRFIQARLRLIHFVSLTKLAIDNHAKNASTKIAQLRSVLHASDKNQIIPAMNAPDGSIEMPSMEELASRLKTIEYLNEDINPHFPAMVHRMAFIDLVAHFDAFLSDAFEAVMVAQPNTLKSKMKQIDYETLLSYSSIEELVRYLVKRELHEVGYKSIRDQAKYYKDRFGVDLAASGIGLEVLVEIQAIRNLFLHNDGIVNELYLKAVPGSKYKRGDAIEISTREWMETDTCLEALAEYVFKELCSKHAKPNADDQPSKPVP